MQQELRHLRAMVTALQREVASERRRARSRQRGLLALLAVVVACTPLALRAAGFVDLVPGSPHNDNIAAIAAVGITRGCNPPANDQYCPTDLVTREQMASFLARTAGLGANPPVANALTAIDARYATTAQAVGGYPPGDLVRAVAAPFSTSALPTTNGVLTDITSISFLAPRAGLVLLTTTVLVGVYADEPGIRANLVLTNVGTSGNQAFGDVPSGRYGGYAMLPITASKLVMAGTLETFTLQIARNIGSGGYYEYGVLTLIYIPFNAGGQPY